jgi:hypothetical protein
MRVLEIQSGNSTPFHSHGWEHETFVLSGQGVVKQEHGEKAVCYGSVIFIEPNEKHSFTNVSGEVLRLIDVIPTAKVSSYTEETNARKHELEPLQSKIQSLGREELYRSDKYYAVRFLEEGVDAYINLFQNATVFYASLAVEITLIYAVGPIRLKKWFKKNPKRKTNPNFKELISLAAKARILNKSTGKKADKVRLMRNCYVHYQNVMLYQHRIDQEVRKELTKLLPKLKKEIHNSKVDERLKEMAISEAEAMHREVDTDDMIIKRKIPYAGLRTSTEVDKFHEERLDALLKWVYEAGPYELLAKTHNEKATQAFYDLIVKAYKRGSTEAIEDGLKKQLAEYNRRYEYGIERYDARDCLIWSAEIISYLGFLQ